MQTAQTTPGPLFSGSDDEQKIAREIFTVMRASGRFFSPTAPIRATVSSLGEFLASRVSDRSAEEWAESIERIVELNPDVFGREEVDGRVVIVTTAAGRSPETQPQDQAHTLARRFAEPIPRPQPAPVERRTLETTRPERSIAEADMYVEIPALEAAESITVEEIEPALDETEEVDATVAPPTTVEVVTASDLSMLDDATLAGAIAGELRADLSVANFGDLWMAEDKVPRLSRGDLRRIREYLLERNRPLTDDTLLQDVLSIRPQADNFELMRFALNFRLSRESREFEFVGTTDQRLWSTIGLPAIGTTKRKASELGQDYRYLLEEPTGGDSEESVVEHVLTFYEYQYGVLPYGGVFASLFPPPMLPEQRTAVLSFESPQTYETFFVELRYPTGNRGGYVAGFDRFFLENLVPGALLTIERSQNNGHYLFEFLPVSGEDRKLLQLDEKKNRFVFRPMTFYCATQEGMVLSENRFAQLANLTPLEERVRRRPEQVLAAVFERIGEQVGTSTAPKYMAMIDDLFVVANVERPMSVSLIRRIASSDVHPGFSADPDVEDVYYYEPQSGQ